MAGTITQFNCDVCNKPRLQRDGGRMVWAVYGENHANLSQAARFRCAAAGRTMLRCATKDTVVAGNMTKSLLAIRHVAFEDLGAFETPLKDAGFALHYADMGVDAVAGFGDPDLLVVLGGPIGAYEDDVYPWLKDEIAFIGARLAANKPTLGICLGAQLMARALGARVYPGPAKEIGWKPLTLTKEGESLLAPFAGLPVLHWHGDTFDLPKAAENLAGTGICKHQAFRYGRHGLAFQFHPEAQEHGFERWLIGHAGEIAATPNVSVAGLRADTAKFASASLDAGRAVLRNWLGRRP
jgi:GMP synthase (glutamine-hydrolysing)